MDGACSIQREMISAYKIFKRKTGREVPVGRRMCRWEDSIEIDHNVRCEDVDWIHLAVDGVQWWAFVHTLMNLRVPATR
jgi:hypothetical protein